MENLNIINAISAANILVTQNNILNSVCITRGQYADNGIEFIKLTPSGQNINWTMVMSVCIEFRSKEVVVRVLIEREDYNHEDFNNFRDIICNNHTVNEFIELVNNFYQI